MNETQIIEVASSDWQGAQLSAPREHLLAALELGKVLYFPRLNFALEGSETALLDSRLADPERKNISLSPAAPGLESGATRSSLLGVLGDAPTQAVVEALVTRFQHAARALVGGLFPEYAGIVRAAPTSLRLHRVETRQTSWRKDDSRLHVDAFPSRPNYGERILRVFSNINPSGAPRVWRVGEPFEAMARRFLPRIRAPLPGSAALLSALHITKGPRSRYDHLMLKLHDAMKADLAYQRDCPQQTIRFPPSSAWICFSDQTSHAVMAGQFMLEQTFFLPVRGMARPERAPLGVLQRLTRRVLI